MVNIIGRDVNEAYEEMKWQIKINGKEEQSRNGPVLTIQEPVMTMILRPAERVLFDPVRNANPFFHVMEFIWMMAGSKDLAWIKQFNTQMGKYSDDQNTLPASYGFRWRKHFGVDQVTAVIEQLRRDPTTRRAVIGMWDPRADLGGSDPNSGLDKPCNTQIYFRSIDGTLDMLVTNRSNDAIWGAFGANAVHMSFLHELIARGAGLRQGVCRTLTNNLHVYTQLPRIAEILGGPPRISPYKIRQVEPYPLLDEGESVEQFLEDCENFVGAEFHEIETTWVTVVAEPIYAAYLNKDMRYAHIEKIAATDWRLACKEWYERRNNLRS